MLPGEEQHNFLRIHLIKTYNWTRIGTIFLAKAKYNLVLFFFYFNFFSIQF